MTEVETVTVKDIAIGIYDGPHATPKESDEGPIFLGIKNVTPSGSLDLSTIRHVSEEQYPRWTKRVVPQAGDIVFSYEATLHRYALIPEGFRGCLGRRMALVRPDRSKTHPRFLHYYFLASAWRAVVESNIISGATVDRIPLTKFPDFELKLPPLRTQERIAELLAAYDDLIENNRRRIQLLEESARLLYKEWFVHLRFPGHEHVKVIDGVPDGWERRPLRACATFLSGGTPSKKRSAFWEGDIPWVSSGELTRMRIHRTSLNITAEAVAAGSRLVPQDTVLMVVRGMSLAKELRMGMTARSVAFNQDIKALSAVPDIDPLLLFQSLDNQRESIRERTGDASHGTKKLDTPVLSEVPILVPTDTVQTLFREHVAPLHMQWDTLDQENQLLSRARDLLLPRLMNGEVAV